MKLTLAISALALLGACEDFTLRGHPLPRCGYANNGGFTGSTDLPATNEGNGWVGLMRTSWDDTGGGSEYYKLLQCKSGIALQGSYSSGLRVVGYGESSPPQPENSLIDFVRNYSFDWELGNVPSHKNFWMTSKRHTTLAFLRAKNMQMIVSQMETKEKSALVSITIQEFVETGPTSHKKY